MQIDSVLPIYEKIIILSLRQVGNSLKIIKSRSNRFDTCPFLGTNSAAKRKELKASMKVGAFFVLEFGKFNR